MCIYKYIYIYKHVCVVFVCMFMYMCVIIFSFLGAWKKKLHHFGEKTAFMCNKIIVSVN